MNREQLKDIRARWTGYIAKSDAERKALFESWLDKRDFWDLCDAVESALDGVDLELGQPTMLRLAADALAGVTKDRMIEEWVRKYNESQAEVRDLTLKMKDLEKFLATAAEVASLRAEVAGLRAMVETLKARIAELEQRS